MNQPNEKQNDPILVRDCTSQGFLGVKNNHFGDAHNRINID
jgi:hypothetical protein